MAATRLAPRICNILQRSSVRSLNSVNQKRFYASGNEMEFTFASSGQVLYNKANVKQVDVPTYSGSFGILANHVPSLAVLKPGVVAVTEADGSSNRYFVSSGSVTINEDSTVQILAEEAVSVSDLDPQVCRDSFAKAQQDSSSATSESAKIEAQIAMEVSEALVKAVEVQ